MCCRLLPVVFLLGLTACNVTQEQCDPRNADAGLGTKLGCSTRGVYAERVVQKERVLLDEQKANQLFRAVYASLEQEQRDVGKQRSQQQNRYAELSRSLAALLSEVKRPHAQSLCAGTLCHRVTARRAGRRVVRAGSGLGTALNAAERGTNHATNCPSVGPKC